MISDFHVHTKFSGDSKADLDRVILAAIDKGMPYLAITDHNDFECDNGNFELDAEKYFECISSKRNEYKNDITIAVGLECGLDTRYKDRIANLINSFNFDFVIGSSHTVNGIDPYYKEYFENKSIHDAVAEYLESIIENIECFDCFDIYGHLDYVIRYAPLDTSDKRCTYEEYHAQFDKILSLLIKKGKGIEINTSSLRKGLIDTNPNIDVVKKYRELGGKIITIGSDAHKPEDIGADFDIAKDMLVSSGFTYYNTFLNRTSINVSF